MLISTAPVKKSLGKKLLPWYINERKVCENVLCNVRNIVVEEMSFEVRRCKCNQD